MKTTTLKLSLLLALLFSLNVWGQNSSTLDGIGGDSGGPKQSWAEILDNPKLKPHFPAVVIQGHLVDYNILCVEKSSQIIRTKYQVKIVSEDLFEGTIFDYLYEFPNGDHYTCVSDKNRCYFEDIPTSQNIFVYRVEQDYSSGSRPVLFRKHYEIPVCK